MHLWRSIELLRRKGWVILKTVMFSYKTVFFIFKIKAIVNKIRKDYYANILDKDDGKIIVLSKNYEFTAIISDDNLYIFTLLTHPIKTSLPSCWRLECSGGKRALVYETKGLGKAPIQVAEAIISAIKDIEKGVVNIGN